MPVILSPQTAQVTLVYTGSVFDSGGGATVLGFISPEEFGPVSIEDLAEITRSAFSDFMTTGLSDLVTLSAVRAVSSLYGAEVGASAVGDITGDTTPPNTALLVNYTTARRGRRARGRSFFPGMTFENTTSDTGILDPAWQSSQQARVDGFFDAITTAIDGDQVILQNDDGISPPISPPPAVISRVVNSRVATQRRRLRR